MTRDRSYAAAIAEATAIAMEIDERILCFGLGVDDPKRIFGTTAGLVERFGPRRVFDMPTSEAAMTGVAIGASLDGARCLMTHQRLDFFLLTLDQIVNNAAKWRYMFGGQAAPVRIVVRLILGRGWGQGPTHSQNLQAWFAHIPGLKVVMPASPADAKGLLLSALFDDNPVLFLEHRWLHQMQGELPEGDHRVPIGKAAVMAEGSDLTIVTMSSMTVETLHALPALQEAGISAEVIDLRSIRPLDLDTVLASVRKTGRLLAVDTASPVCSVASEIVATAACECFDRLEGPPRRLALPDFPVPTSPALTDGFYPRAEQIAVAAAGMLGRTVDVAEIVASRTSPHDVPGDWFKGPF
ncbi:MAG: alpha-ketoacid dehydrogenase subunit beta [Planctomycetota bacterium]